MFLCMGYKKLILFQYFHHPNCMAKKKKTEKHIHHKTSRVKADPVPKWHLPLILILTFIVYIPALNAGFVNWDDPEYVGENNYLIRDLSRLPDLLPQPIKAP